MIGLILIVYSGYPDRLVRSVEASTRHPIKWYFFYHGVDSRRLLQLAVLSKCTNSRIFPYRVNRGVARSWNDGLAMSAADSNALSILVNDDLFFYPGCFDKFIGFVQSREAHAPGWGLCMPLGFEPAGPFRGHALPQYFACCALGRAAMERVGFFDENFVPAYFEDLDYLRRLRLAGLPVVLDRRVLVEHDRSHTIRTDPTAKVAVESQSAANARYYRRKWGGSPHNEVFTRPFDDRSFDCTIAADRRHAPYGPGYDAAAASEASHCGAPIGGRGCGAER